MKLAIPFFAFGLISVGACGGGAANQSKCGANRTEVDGVCVSNQVADYVACIRSQGAQLGSDRSSKLSADASFAGAHAGGASEAKETLEKKYAATSDENTKEILRTCAAAMHGQATAAPAATGNGDGNASKSPPETSGGSMTAVSSNGGDGAVCLMVNSGSMSIKCYWAERQCTAQVEANAKAGVGGSTCKAFAQAQCYGFANTEMCFAYLDECKASLAQSKKTFLIQHDCQPKSGQ